MRIIVADCCAVYAGRLDAILPRARRVIMVKKDMSVLIFSEIGSYKPLNWMAAPCTVREYAPGDAHWDALCTDVEPAVEAGGAPLGEDGEAEKASPVRFLRASAKKGPDILTIALFDVDSDTEHDLGSDPGLVKDGVEDQLQRCLADQIDRIGEGARLVRREYPTPIGPVDIMAVDSQGRHVAIEVKRHGGVDGVEQLTRYVTILGKDPLLSPVRGILAAQTITPQARVLARTRGLECLILDYEGMKARGDGALTLF